MSGVDVETIVKQVEELLAKAGALPEEAEQAIEKLLNVVEALSADKKELTDEVQRLRKQLEQKKKAKTTAEAPQDAEQPSPNDSDHSSEKRRRKRDPKRRTRPRPPFVQGPDDSRNDRVSGRSRHAAAGCGAHRRRVGDRPRHRDQTAQHSFPATGLLFGGRETVFSRAAAQRLRPGRLQCELAGLDLVAEVLRQHERAEDPRVPG